MVKFIARLFPEWLMMRLSTRKKEGYLIAQLNALVKGGSPQHDYPYLSGQFPREREADGSIVVKLREYLVESPGLAVFVNLRLPSVRHLGEHAGAVNYRQAPIQTPGYLFGRVSG